VGLSFVINVDLYWFLILVIISGAFMLNAFLSFGATHEFLISFFGIGPTEVRIGLIVMHISIIIFGKAFFAELVPFFAVSLLFILLFLVYKTQKKLWRMDKRAV
jgi:hypothetical protein